VKGGEGGGGGVQASGDRATDRVTEGINLGNGHPGASPTNNTGWNLSWVELGLLASRGASSARESVSVPSSAASRKTTQSYSGEQQPVAGAWLERDNIQQQAAAVGEEGRGLALALKHLHGGGHTQVQWLQGMKSRSEDAVERGKGQQAAEEVECNACTTPPYVIASSGEATPEACDAASQASSQCLESVELEPISGLQSPR
jgi:hypothetical protein